MPGFTDIIGQNRPIRQLQSFLRNATLPHALLFTGIAGIGKQNAALALAMALNCQRVRIDASAIDACGQCPPCRKIAAQSHPDILRITPTNDTLRIDQIRWLLNQLAMKPHSAGHRVVTIVDSHAMNAEAANALLKVLEEPPDNTILILTALQQSSLLPTIVSRCRHVAFHPLPADVLADHLVARRGIDAAMARHVAALAAGSLATAERMADGSWMTERRWVLNASGLDAAGRNGRQTAAAALAFSAQLARRKDRVLELLDILKSWIRDLIIWPWEPSLVINTDSRHEIPSVRAGLEDDCLLSLWSTVEKAQKDIAARANLRLTLDLMAIRMFQATAGSVADKGKSLK